MKRLKVLLSAYACEPGEGSEPGVGWNAAVHLAQHHDVWVLTRANNRVAIERELEKNPIPNLHFVYHDLPSWARFWKRGQRGVQLYYYLWQLTAIPLVRKLHRKIGFDVAHHVTFVKYWSPSALAFLDDVPFVWGPVGGGESAPLAFWPTFGIRGIVYETLRSFARFMGELDPLVRYTARKAKVALATTEETARRLRKLRAKEVRVLSEAALSDSELEKLGALPPPPEHPVRFLSLGRLLHWKGFHLGIEAFAKSRLQDAEYWIVGDGPERRRLEALAMRLGVGDRVRFFGRLPRDQVLDLLGQVHVLVHPSLHDSGGWVSLEAMAAGRPVLALDLGGPAVQVADSTGIKEPAENPEQVIADMASAMRRLANDPSLRLAPVRLGRERMKQEFSWSGKAQLFAEYYIRLVEREHQC